MKNLSEILKIRREQLGLTLAQIAEKMNVSEATVQRWESGNIKSLRYDKIDKLAEVLNVTPAAIMGWEDIDENANSNPLFDNILPISRQRLPLLGEIACGQPIFTNEDRESYVEAGTDVKADFCLRCRGDSMINARIFDGDIVFIRKQETVNNGEIAAVVIDDEATLKRVYFRDNYISLVAENPAYEPIFISQNDGKSVYILGKAVAFQSDIK